MTPIKNNEQYNLRSAVRADALLLFEWANDPMVREMSINSKLITWEEHLKWIERKFESDICRIYILEQNNIPVGQIRYDYINGEWSIDYSIGQQYRGKGLGQTIIELSLPLFQGSTINAIVKKENSASNKVFKNLGFILSNEEKINDTDYLKYHIRV